MSANKQDRWLRGRPDDQLSQDGAQRYWHCGRAFGGLLDPADVVRPLSPAQKAWIRGQPDTQLNHDGTQQFWIKGRSYEGLMDYSTNTNWTATTSMVGIGTAAFDPRQTWLGSIEADGVGTMIVRPSVIIHGSMSSAGIATAQFSVRLLINGSFACQGIATVSARLNGTIYGRFEADGIATVNFDSQFVQHKYWINGRALAGMMRDNHQTYWLRGRPEQYFDHEAPDGAVTMNGVGSMVINSTHMAIVGRMVAQGVATALFTGNILAQPRFSAAGVGTARFTSKQTMSGRFTCAGAASNITFITYSNGVPIEGLISSLPPAVFPAGGSVGILFDSPHSY